MASGVPRKARGLLPKKEITIHVAMDATLYGVLVEQVERTGNTLSEIVRAALRSHYATAEQEVQP